MTILPSVQGPTGLHQAIGLYGHPREWQCAYRVSGDDLDHWRKVVAHRSAEVVLVLRRPGGVVLHTKDFYPTGAYRLLTGGIRPGEDLALAVQREAREETGLDVTINCFLGIIHHRFVHGEDVALLTSFVVAVQGASEPLRSLDEDERITAYREVPVEDLPEVARFLQTLPPDWVDWGRFRAIAHYLVHDALDARRDAGAGA